ncbi:MAG: hypothetical protein LBT46_05425 [Planctomycetaceae bacterium]|jgi:uncharacterized lipoprotein YddW (UPF0748 family)|nr:hypothetical protein [Planctomycetaceae bacterium]
MPNNIPRRRFLQTVSAAAASAVALPVFAAEPQQQIKAYCIDYNWYHNGQDGFAKPGTWADADPAEHVRWFKDLGCNTMQTFCVSCNGYAWYKNGIVPEQPGLKHDFLPEVVQLCHKEKMTVFGYFCIGANPRWRELHPDEIYPKITPTYIPLTNRYLDYLASAVEDAVKKTGIDGFMVDWLWNPCKGFQNPWTPVNQWLPCEQTMYAELMDEKFPGIDKVTAQQTDEFRKRSINRCWKRIHEAAKGTSKNCLIWLSCHELYKPEIADSQVLKEVDWLLNEHGDIKTLREVVTKIGKHTQLLTCLANWNKQDPVKMVRDAAESGLNIGLYGFCKPAKDSPLPLPVQTFLSKPVESFQGDERNLAVLARVYNGLALEYTAERR